jgi:recombinational DNA repair protein (RecF pathway)
VQEYITRAVVLDKTMRGGEADARYSFFTERYGKISARAKSSRKLISKLAGHLEPGTLAAVRIIEQHGAQVVDALKVARVDLSLADLLSLNNLLGEWEPDRELWEEIASSHQSFSWANTLAILGWDPRGAACVQCGRGAARQFFIPRQEFFCTTCTSGYSKKFNHHLILI